MSETAFQNTSAGQSPVGTLLRTTGFFGRITLLLTFLCGGFAIAITAILIAVVLDAISGFPPAVLLAIDIVFLLGLIAGAVTLVSAWRRNRGDPRRLARLVEQRMEIDDSSLINSLQLSMDRPEHCSKQLVTATISTGNELAKDLSPMAALNFRLLGRWFLTALLTAFIALLVTVLYPSVVRSVIPRLVQPFAGHPPYTSVEFSVRVEPETLYQARPATVHVDMAGPHTIDRANLVFIDQQRSGEATVAPLLSVDENQFTYDLHNVEDTIRFYVDTPKGRSRVYRFNALPIPLLENVRVHYEFPEYTGWKSVTKSLNHEGIQAIRGTRVHMQATGNIQLRSGSLDLIPTDGDAADQRPMEPLANDPATVKTDFELTSDGEFELRITSLQGGTSEPGLRGRLVALPDRQPQIAIVSPEQHVMAVEGWKVPVSVQAIDDVGIAQIQLLPSINGWGPYPQQLPIENESRNLVQTGYEFDLDKLGARAGDVIGYYAAATDVSPTADQIATTDTYVIQVITLEEYQEIARQEYRMEDVLAEMEHFRRQLESLAESKQEILDEIAKLQDELAESGELTDEQEKQLQALREQLESFEQAATQLAEQMQQRAENQPLYDFDETYQQMLREMAEQLANQNDLAQELSSSLEKLQQNPSNANQQSLQSAASEFENAEQPFGSNSQQEMAELNQDMQQLQGGEQLVGEVNRLQQLIQDQRDLADRMGEFRNEQEMNEDQASRLRQMAKQQDLLEQELNQLLDDIQAAASDAAESFPKAAESAQGIVDTIRDMQVMQDQNQAASAGREPVPAEAHQFADTAARKLESLQCDSCNGQAVSQQMGQGDAPLRLTKGQRSGSMQQLLESLSAAPSMLPRPGQTGQQGSGFRGSMSRSALYGPQLPGPANRQNSRRGGQDRDQRGVAAVENQLQYDIEAEILNPDSRESDQLLQQYMRGVPSAYRDQARAYLKRLAEEDR